MMKQRKYFEIYASVGRKCVPDKDMPYKVGTLLSDMKYARIHGYIWKSRSNQFGKRQ